MAVTLECPGCNKKLRAGDELSGKKTKCPSCSLVFAVPAFAHAQSAKPAAPPQTPAGRPAKGAPTIPGRGAVEPQAHEEATVLSRKRSPSPLGTPTLADDEPLPLPAIPSIPELPKLAPEHPPTRAAAKPGSPATPSPNSLSPNSPSPKITASTRPTPAKPAPAAPPASTPPPAPAEKAAGGETYELDFGDDPAEPKSASQPAPVSLAQMALLGLEAGPSGPLAQAPAAPAPGQLAPAPLTARDFENAPVPRAAATRRERERQEAHKHGPKSYGEVFGHDITHAFIAKGVLLLLVLAYGVHYLFFKNPVAFVASQAVDIAEPVRDITRMKGATVMNPMGGGTPGEYAIGGSDRCLVTRPNPKGEYLIVHIAASQRYFNDRKQFVSGYGVTIKQSDIKLRRGGKDEEPWIFARQLTHNHRFSLAEAKTTDYHGFIPAGAEPTATQLRKGREGGDAGGKLVFVGQNAEVKGEIDYTSYFGAFGAAASGLSAEGKLTYQRPSGISINLDYSGDYLTLETDPQDSVWHGVKLLHVEDDINVFARIDLLLLFKRPPGAGDMELFLGDERVARVRDRFDRQDDRLFVSSQSYETPRRETQGGNIMADKSGKPKLSGGYVDTVLGAKKMAEGTASMANMRNILTSVTLFREAKKRFPKDVHELAGEFPNIEAALRNPRTKEKFGYILEAPPPDHEDPDSAPILWEKINGQKDEEGLVGYANGEIE